MIGDLWQDLHYGIRMIRKYPGFTAVAVLTLALGIGANTALFSLVDAVLLKMLPVKNPEHLVLFSWASGIRRTMGTIDGNSNYDPATGLVTSTSFSYLTFEQFRAHNQTLSDVFAFARLYQLNVNVGGQADIATGQLISGGYYTGLGVPAIRGRVITEDDNQANADPVAVISHRYWQRRFGGDPEIVGKAVNINNVAFTIIGITPPNFFGTMQVGEAPEFSIPMAMEPRLRPRGSNLSEPWYWWLQIMGRPKPGVGYEQVCADLEGVLQQTAMEGWDSYPPERRSPEDQGPRDLPQLRVESGSQGLNEVRQSYAQPLRILMVIVGLVLAIVCTNIANLLLARAVTRRKEIGVRLALGASRWRLIRQLLTESVLLALLGGALGVLFGYWAKDFLVTWNPWGHESFILDLKLDLRVLGFTTAISVCIGILFGIAPAWRATQVDLHSALKDDSRNLGGGSRSYLSKSLITAQVAMSLVLLIGAGLFVRTLHNLQNVDVGFNSKNLLIFRVDPRLNNYNDAQIANLYEQLIEHIEAVPGVRSASISRHPLLSGSAMRDGINLQGQTSLPGAGRNVYVLRVRPNFFNTMEMPLVSGRNLTEQDDKRAPRVAVINQALARQFFQDDNPIGRRFGFGNPEHNSDIEIVGVVGDTKYTSLRQNNPPTVYIPYLQETLTQMNFEVRTTGDPLIMLPSIREAVRQVDGNLPLFDIKTQMEQAEESLAQERLFANLTTFFGLLALLLACIGLYGVISYSVAWRTREVGIRMALGAQRGDVIIMVMRESLSLVLIGLTIGLGAALATTRFISSMLYGLTPTDTATILAAVFMMIMVAAVASYLPGRRASRVEPMVALRYE